MDNGTSGNRGGRSRASHSLPLRRALKPVVETLENRWLLSAGDVDLTLTAGLFGPSGDSVTAVLRQGSKTIVAGESFGSGDAFLARYDASGNLDTTFGNAGRTNIDLGGGDDVIRALTIDSGGNIVAAGASNGNMAVARLTANGQLDASFDGDGVQTVSFFEPAGALSVSASGGVIALGGSSGFDPAARHFAVAELDASGQLTGFGTQVTAIGDDAVVNSVLVDGVGNVYAGGQSTTAGQTSFTVAKYNTGGLDATFDGPDLLNPGNGVVVTTLGGASSIKSLAFHGTGVLAIGTGAGVAMAQYDGVTGLFDPTFNAGAPFQANVGGINVTSGGVDSAGRIYAMGTVQNGGPRRPGALRFLATGAVTLDGTYGAGGVGQSGLTAASNDEPYLALATDGSISAAVESPITVGGNDVGTITSAGAAGATGSTGFTIATDDAATAVYVDATGATYLAGATTDVANDQRHGFILKRLASGAVDTTFGTNGVVGVDFGTDLESVTGLAVDASGRLLVAGVTFNTVTGAAVARYLPNGTLDASFGNNGVVTVVLPLGDSVGGTDLGVPQIVRVAADGNDVVVAGTAESDFGNVFVARYLGANGAADPAFNGGQTAVNDLAQPLSPAGVTADAVYALTVNAHNIYVGGVTSDDAVDYNAVVVKYTPAGVIDTSFDTDGIVITDFGNSADAINGLAIDASGRIVAAGASGNAIAVARYNAATGAAVDQTILGLNTVGGAQGLAIDASGNLVLAATTVDGGNVHHLSAVRLTNSLALDAGFGAGGVAQATFAGASDAAAVAIGADGKITVAGSTVAGSLDVAAARFLGTVVVVNQPPVVNPIVGPSTGLWQSQLTFTGSYSDPGDVTVHTQTWVVRNAANQVVFTASGSTLNWTPNAVGTFTVTFTVTDNNGAGLSGSASKNVTVTSAAVVGGVLTIQGNGSGNTISVNRTGTGDYRVLVDGQAAQVFSQASVASLFLTGGDGADVITIASGVNVLNEVHGGNGNDVITGGGGGDMLFGEAGNDQLMSRGQADILVGGDGDDYLDGGAGRDVLIGGTGADIIFGDNGDDVLIAAYTTHDADPATLNAIRTAWTGGGNYADRVAALKATLLRPGVDYFDDNIIDLMSGDEGKDWFIANTSGSGAHDLVVSDLFREVVTDI